MMSKSHKTTNEREREKKRQTKKRKKSRWKRSPQKPQEHTNRQLVKEFVSVFEKFLHFFPSLYV